MTLEDLYKKIAEKRNVWCYYPKSKLDVMDVLDDKEKSYNFIKSYFSYAGKNGVFEDVINKENIKIIKERAQHIVSTFLLSIEIAKIFNVQINNKNDCFDFKYYLFMACLYHDVGYVYEQMKESLINKCEVKANGFEAIKKTLNIKYFSNDVFKTYSKEDVEIYFKGRAKENLIDHGIVGGILLYDRLRKQFCKMFENRKDSESTKERFIFRDVENEKIFVYQINIL